MTLNGNQISKDKFDILIYQQNVINTYLYFIKENLSLIRRLLNQKQKYLQPYDPNKKEILYKARAKHLQVMILLGSIAEHLTKIILLKRGFIINKTDNCQGYTNSMNNKFSDDFMKKLKKFNKIINPSQKEINKIYLEAKKDIGCNFSSETLKFFDCIKLLLKSNSTYHKKFLYYVKRYKIDKKYQLTDSKGKRYLKKFDNLNKHNCLNVIREMRNNYIHIANARYENQGVYWYMYNYLLCLAKEEFPSYFKCIQLIGNDEIKNLFKK